MARAERCRLAGRNNHYGVTARRLPPASQQPTRLFMLPRRRAAAWCGPLEGLAAWLVKFQTSSFASLSLRATVRSRPQLRNSSSNNRKATQACPASGVPSEDVERHMSPSHMALALRRAHWQAQADSGAERNDGEQPHIISDRDLT